jgi:NTE family protein
LAAQTVLVLGGGNALAAYHAGAYEEMVRQDIRPDWIIGASAGAITGAIIAGNPPELRVQRLREFWDEATTKTPFEPSRDPKLRQYYNGWHVAWATLFGRPSIFQHRWPGFWGILPGPQNDIALYDHRPLAATLERLIDFDLLNRSEIRLSVGCVDIETGDEVVFDTREDRIGPEHIRASAAITPGFPPLEIGGRMLCDPGYANNSPVDLAFATPPDRDTLVILLELFSLRSPRPASIDAVLERTQDILFASPTRKAIAALRREYALRAEMNPDLPAIRLLHLAYQAAAHELAMKSIDFSPSSVRDRWAAGARDLAAGLGRLNATPSEPGLAYVTLPDPVAASSSAESVITAGGPIRPPELSRSDPVAPATRDLP